MDNVSDLGPFCSSCGGDRGLREPSDADGLGCLENIYHSEDIYQSEDVDEDDLQKATDITMMTCPYYWADRIPDAMCRNGCWQEPTCQTGGPWDTYPDWPPERLLAYAVDRHVQEPFPG